MAGGVAIQPILPEQKQRAMHPSRIASPESGKDETPTPFKREYNQPGILYPVYNHCLSLTDEDFATVAYAFLDSLPRIGAGNPKGIGLAEDAEKLLLVVDRYLVPKGKRPIISPSETNPESAIENFWRLAQTPEENTDYIQVKHFERWIGDKALEKLQEYASIFVDEVLQK